MQFAPDNQHDAGFRVDAVLEVDSKDKFKRDMLTRENIVPVQVTFFWSEQESREGVSFQFAENRMDPKLYLPNGEALRNVPITEMRDRLDRASSKLVGDADFTYTGFSPKSKDAGYLYFQLPEQTRVRDTEVFIKGRDGFVHAMDLRKSLLNLTYGRRDEGIKSLREINVGLR